MIRGFNGPEGQAFADDWLKALRAASENEDHDAVRKINVLVLDHLWCELCEMNSRKLTAYLKQRVWRTHERVHVYKTPDLPCVVYTVHNQKSNLEVLALGICYQFPGGTVDAWWDNILLPRLIKSM